jgi:hypothetical protein
MTDSFGKLWVAVARPKDLPMVCLYAWEAIGKLALAAATRMIYGRRVGCAHHSSSGGHSPPCALPRSAKGDSFR